MNRNWSDIVNAVVNRANRTEYFLTREDEREIKRQSGYESWSDRMQGYDMEERAEQWARSGRDAAVQALQTWQPPEATVEMAEMAAQAAEFVLQQGKHKDRYANRGFELVARLLRMEVEST
jgi:hypothetical protein